MYNSLFMQGLCVFFPFLDNFLKAGSELRIELHPHICHRVLEAKGLRVQGLPGDQGKTIVNELPVLRMRRSFQDLVSAIFVVVEQRMAEVFQVRTDLVRPAGFELALY